MSFADLISKTVLPNIFQPLVALLIGLALVYFLIGAVKYLSRSASDEERRAGRQMMIYGIVALAVMVAVWGLVNVLLATFKDLKFSIPPAPRF